MNTEHVGLETITNENLESIIMKCQEQLKNKQLQEGIYKIINENK